MGGGGGAHWSCLRQRTTASSYDELTTMIANRDDEKLAVIGIALMVTLLLVTNGRNPPILSVSKNAFSKSSIFSVFLA